jgi:flavin reductase (DIM6/NTAB) family NADH-FMN oxidoreductase RutF
MHVDLAELSGGDCYRLMIQAIIPRPVAWVLTDNGDGSSNLAPYSFFTGVSSRPPLLVISAGRKPGGDRKDTVVNIEARAPFVVHIAHQELAPAVTETSRTLPHGESEVEHVGLRTVPFEGFGLPRLADCRIAMGCTRHQLVEVEGTAQTLVFGRIERMYIDDAVLGAAGPDARVPAIDAGKVDPIGRLGGDEYSTFGELLSIPRPR